MTMTLSKTAVCLKCNSSNLKYSKPVTKAEADSVGGDFTHFALCNGCGYVMTGKEEALFDTPALASSEIVLLAAEKLLDDNERSYVKYSESSNKSDAKPLPKAKKETLIQEIPIKAESESDSERRQRVIKEAEMKANAARKKELPSEPVAAQESKEFTFFAKVYKFFKSIFKS